MIRRAVLRVSTFLLTLSVAAVGNNLNANHPCIEVLNDATSVLDTGQSFNGKSQSEFSGTAWECVASTAQGVASTVQYFAGSAVESFNQGEPQRALGDFVSASKGLAQEAHLAFNQHLQSTLAGLQQRQ
jgi:hypothetical protein